MSKGDQMNRLLQKNYETQDFDSDASALFDLGKRYLFTFSCKCDKCIETREMIVNDVKPQVLELAKTWYNTSPGVQLRGFIENWSDCQIEDHLNLQL